MSDLTDVKGQCRNPFSQLSFGQLMKYMAVFLVSLGLMNVMGYFTMQWIIKLFSFEE